MSWVLINPHTLFLTNNAFLFLLGKTLPYQVQCSSLTRMCALHYSCLLLWQTIMIGQPFLVPIIMGLFKVTQKRGFFQLWEKDLPQIILASVLHKLISNPSKHGHYPCFPITQVAKIAEYFSICFIKLLWLGKWKSTQEISSMIKSE